MSCINVLLHLPDALFDAALENGQDPAAPARLVGPLLAAVHRLIHGTGAAPSGKFALFERRPRRIR